MRAVMMLALTHCDLTQGHDDLEVGYKINKGVLRELDFPWACQDLAKIIHKDSSSVINAYRRMATQLLLERFNRNDCWMFADPDTVLLLPFWQAVFQASKIEESYVIVLQHPLAFAKARQQSDIETGLLIWLRSMVLSVEGTHGRQRSVTVNAQAQEYLDEELHSHPAMKVVPLCLQIYPLLRRVASGQLAFTDAEFHAAWQSIRREFDLNYQVYNELHTIRKSYRALLKELRKIKQTFLWKALQGRE